MVSLDHLIMTYIRTYLDCESALQSQSTDATATVAGTGSNLPSVAILFNCNRDSGIEKLRDLTILFNCNRDSGIEKLRDLTHAAKHRSVYVQMGEFLTVGYYYQPTLISMVCDFTYINII